MMPVNQLKFNPNNPRVILDENFQALVDSIKQDGFMLSIRFIVVDKHNVVVGGNQRLKACQVAGVEQVPVVRADDLSKEQLKEFVIKDNIYYGTWNKEALAEHYSDAEMVQVGMKLIEVAVPRMETIGDIQPEIDQSDLEKRKETYENNAIKQIVCYFPAELYEKVVQSIDAIKKHMGVQETPEVLLNLITYWKRNYAR
jgi:ParB-like chromosome segregation protein Spo0J